MFRPIETEKKWVRLRTEQKLGQEVITEVTVQYEKHWAALGRTFIPKSPDVSVQHLVERAEKA